jgi:hypothetical protein
MKEQTDKNIAYIIKEIWTYSFENHPAVRKGYRAIAVFYDEKLAKEICNKKGLHTNKYSSAIDEYSPQSRFFYTKVKSITNSTVGLLLN